MTADRTPISSRAPLQKDSPPGTRPKCVEKSGGGGGTPEPEKVPAPREGQMGSVPEFPGGTPPVAGSLEQGSKSGNNSRKGRSSQSSSPNARKVRTSVWRGVCGPGLITFGERYAPAGSPPMAARNPGLARPANRNAAARKSPFESVYRTKSGASGACPRNRPKGAPRRQSAPEPISRPVIKAQSRRPRGEWGKRAPASRPHGLHGARGPRRGRWGPVSPAAPTNASGSPIARRYSPGAPAV